jgi:hypothetical protein
MSEVTLLRRPANAFAIVGRHFIHEDLLLRVLRFLASQTCHLCKADSGRLQTPMPASSKAELSKERTSRIGTFSIL